MQSHLKTSGLISLILAAGLLFFASCSQNSPELYNADYSIVFDYADETSKPSARLSVFATSNSEVRRYNRIQIQSLESGYIWDTDIVAKLEAEDLQWAGCTNIVAPEDEKLPKGKYQVTYFNADEKEYSVTIDVNYDTEFYDLLLPALPDFMTKNRGIEKIAIYDKQHIMIYFGNRTSELKTTRDIWNNYRDAAFYQVIWYTRGGNVICVTPEKPVRPESEQTSEKEESSEVTSEENSEE